MTPQQFRQLADEGYNRIPIMREVLADLETPLSAYLKLADGPYSYLFESVQGGEKWGRYSIIGLPATTLLRVHGHDITLEQDGEIIEEFSSDDPLREIEAFQGDFRVANVEDMPRFNGGLVGYFGYECIRYIEERLHNDSKPDPLGCPDILLMVSEQVVVFDNLNGKLHLIVLANPEEENAYQIAHHQLDQLAQKLKTGTVPYTTTQTTRQVAETDFVSGFTQEDFESAVERIKEYIVEGDTMQVVLSQRLSIPFEAPPINLYRALRCLNPSPYMFYLNLGDFYVVGSSPEILVRKEEREVTVRPIAGTRPRGHDEHEDRELEKDLLQDPDRPGP